MLTDKYLNGIPDGSRATRNDSFSPDMITEETLAKIRALNEIAAGRGQSLAQTRTGVGAPRHAGDFGADRRASVAQLEANVAALDNLAFTAGELDEIDRYAD